MKSAPNKKVSFSVQNVNRRSVRHAGRKSIIKVPVGATNKNLYRKFQNFSSKARLLVSNSRARVTARCTKTRLDWLTKKNTTSTHRLIVSTSKKEKRRRPLVFYKSICITVLGLRETLTTSRMTIDKVILRIGSRQISIWEQAVLSISSLGHMDTYILTMVSHLPICTSTNMARKYRWMVHNSCHLWTTKISIIRNSIMVSCRRSIMVTFICTQTNTKVVLSSVLMVTATKCTILEASNKLTGTFRWARAVFNRRIEVTTNLNAASRKQVTFLRTSKVSRVKTKWAQESTKRQSFRSPAPCLSSILPALTRNQSMRTLAHFSKTKLEVAMKVTPSKKALIQ